MQIGCILLGWWTEQKSLSEVNNIQNHQTQKKYQIIAYVLWLKVYNVTEMNQEYVQNQIYQLNYATMRLPDVYGHHACSQGEIVRVVSA